MESERTIPESEKITTRDWLKRTLDELQEMYPYEYHQAASELFEELGYSVVKEE